MNNGPDLTVHAGVRALSDDHRQAARLLVCTNAHDADDAALLLDVLGLHVCDQDTAALADLIAPAIPGQVGMTVLAQLTDAGQRALAVAS